MAQWEDQLHGGKADRLTPTAFDRRALQEGMRHELEHTRSRRVATEIAMDHLAEDPHYYHKLRKMETMKNPSSTARQRRFMCAEYGRKNAGKNTRTGMTKRQLKDYCKKPLRKWKSNPHLTSGKWRFVGLFKRTDVKEVKRILRIHGIASKVTKVHGKIVKTEKTSGKLKELYVARETFDTAYRAITRLYEGGMAA